MDAKEIGMIDNDKDDVQCNAKLTENTGVAFVVLGEIIYYNLEK